MHLIFLHFAIFWKGWDRQDIGRPVFAVHSHPRTKEQHFLACMWLQWSHLPAEAWLCLSCLPHTSRKLFLSAHPQPNEPTSRFITCAVPTGLLCDFLSFEPKKVTIPNCSLFRLEHHNHNSDFWVLTFRLFLLVLPTFCPTTVFWSNGVGLRPEGRK